MYDIRRMKPSELGETLELIRSVFLEFEAPEYSVEGTQTFIEFIDHKNIQQGIDDGDLKFWVCPYDSGIIGVIAMKNENHVCMLFVDRNFHRQGIAKKLLYKALEDADPDDCITVNSSPYGVHFYHAAGFKSISKQKTSDGIIFEPMKAKCFEIINALENSINPKS